jgi:hypothetical protein
MSRLITLLTPVEDPTTLEEVADKLFNHTDMTSFNEIFEAPKNVEIRGIRTNDLVDYIVREVEEDGTVEYHGIYNDDYVEWQLTPEALDLEYKIVIVITTQVQVFPPL